MTKSCTGCHTDFPLTYFPISSPYCFTCKPFTPPTSTSYISETTGLHTVLIRWSKERINTPDIPAVELTPFDRNKPTNLPPICPHPSRGIIIPPITPRPIINPFFLKPAVIPGPPIDIPHFPRPAPISDIPPICPHPSRGIIIPPITPRPIINSFFHKPAVIPVPPIDIPQIPRTAPIDIPIDIPPIPPIHSAPILISSSPVIPAAPAPISIPSSPTSEHHDPDCDMDVVENFNISQWENNVNGLSFHFSDYDVIPDVAKTPPNVHMDVYTYPELDKSINVYDPLEKLYVSDDIYAPSEMLYDTDDIYDPPEIYKDQEDDEDYENDEMFDIPPCPIDTTSYDQENIDPNAHSTVRLPTPPPHPQPLSILDGNARVQKKLFCSSCRRHRDLSEFQQRLKGGRYKTCKSCSAKRRVSDSSGEKSPQTITVDAQQSMSPGQQLETDDSTSSKGYYCNSCNQYKDVAVFAIHADGLAFRACIPCRTKNVHRTADIPPPVVCHVPAPYPEPPQLAAFLRDSSGVSVHLGEMDIECQNCGALHWISERSPGSLKESPGFESCCKRGLVHVDRVAELPPTLEALITGTTSRARLFRQNIRQYNSAFAFTSLACQTFYPGEGITSFQIHGLVYHKQGSLVPREGENASYAQTYIYKPAQAVKARAERNKNLNHSILVEITDMMEKLNPFVPMYRTAHERLVQPDGPRQLILNPQCRLVDEDSVQDIGTVIPDEWHTPSFRDIALSTHDRGLEGLTKVHSTHAAYMPLHYVLMFPRGEHGFRWGLTLKDSDRRITERMYFRGVLHHTKTSLVPFGFGRLFHQYLNDAWAITDQANMNYIRSHQKLLRAYVYKGVADALSRDNGPIDASSIGKRCIVPSSTVGSRRFTQQCYQDSMAIVRAIGPPTLFITFTANPKWPEIQAALMPGQQAIDRPDLVTRVFHEKLVKLLDLLKNSPRIMGKKMPVFGTTIADVFTVEFQQRGLPHVHLLVWLDSTDRLKFHDRDFVDLVISAEIPEEPHLAQLVKKHMIHGIDETATREADGYPKDLQSETLIPPDGFPIYRRRTERDRYVIPYSPFLLMLFDAHINVEICASAKSIKYIHKYVYKGTKTDAQHVQPADEIDEYLQNRYIGPYYAMWRLMAYAVHEERPSIVRLAVHLPDMQQVIFHDDDTPAEILNKADKSGSTLTAWTKYNLEHEDGRDILYSSFPEHFVFGAIDKKWTIRKTSRSAIGRMYAANPSEGERYYLRLLLTIVRGATSFEDIRTHKGIVHQTFHQACVARGLAADNNEWFNCLNQASDLLKGFSLRMLFVIILVHGGITDAARLWSEFKYLCEADMTLKAMLAHHGKKPTDFRINDVEEELYERFDQEENGVIFEELFAKLNREQRGCFGRIKGALRNPGSAHFFLQGPAGTGKTYLYNCLYQYMCKEGKTVLCVASSGIASILLPNGCTAHSQFNIPLEVNKDSTCGINANSKLARLIRKVDLIIWDEVPMQHKHCFEAVDRTLQDIRHDKRLFGGCSVVFGGDFGQILPVIPYGNRTDIVMACIQMSHRIWPQLKILKLTQNMRVQGDENIEFAKWVRALAHTTGKIEIPEFIPCQHTLKVFFDSIYPGLVNATDDEDYFKGKVILTVLNETVQEINEQALKRLKGDGHTSHSIDNVVVDSDHQYVEQMLPEVLHSVNPSSLQPGILNLKIGAPVILLRNLYTDMGLCNGTRLVVTNIRSKVIQARILSGKFHGQMRLIPKIKMQSSEADLGFVLERIQFPVRLCFAMTINKSQGQSLDHVGIDLRAPVFTHGQLYVAFSRVTSLAGIAVLAHSRTTTACAYSEVLCD